MYDCRSSRTKEEQCRQNQKNRTSRAERRKQKAKSKNFYIFFFGFFEFSLFFWSFFLKKSKTKQKKSFFFGFWLFSVFFWVFDFQKKKKKRTKRNRKTEQNRCHKPTVMDPTPPRQTEPVLRRRLPSSPRTPKQALSHQSPSYAAAMGEGVAAMGPVP